MEDEPRVGAMLRDALVELGYIVKVTVRGAEAREKRGRKQARQVRDARVCILCVRRWGC